MSVLSTYIKEVADAKGMLHQERLRALRWYIKASTDKELIPAIRALTELEHMRILQEAGLREPLATVMLRRYDDLVERRKRR
uniref:Uncharacterized protein n=1 Tax=viral metagenome TaxID=1070528 RepID=A0A6H1ZMM4_9ZZZZ